MGLTREQQKEFAYAILGIIKRDKSLETLTSLSKIASLLVSLTEEENGIAIGLSGYIYELKEIAEGNKDTGWAEYYKKSLDEDLKID